MKNVKQILGLTILILFAATSNAQLKGLGSKLGKAAIKDETPVASPSNKETSAIKPSKKLELDWNTFNMAPAITMSSLLYGTQVSNSGNLRLNTYTASFIPFKKTDGSMVNSVYDKDGFLKIKTYKDGALIKEFIYDGGTTFDDNKLRKFISETCDISLKETGTGMYRIDFYAADKMFYTFDFEVYKLANNDPYAKLNEMYLSRGPWNKYAWMEQQKSGNMVFGFYLNHEEFQPNAADPNKTAKDVNWTINITKDDKPFATQYDSRKPVKGKVERGVWTEMPTAMKTADGLKVIQLPDFTDGAYKVEVKVDGEVKSRIYTFNVANNKIVLMNEQDRSKNTDSTKLIEGWNNFYWFKLQ